MSLSADTFRHKFYIPLDSPHISCHYSFMTQHTIPYGSNSIPFSIPTGVHLGTLTNKSLTPITHPEHVISKALQEPIGLSHPALHDFSPTDTVAIVVSDSFRQTRADIMVPVIIEELTTIGILPENISIVFATGVHRGPTPKEQAEILGPSMAHTFQSRLFNHDANDTENLVHLGTTSRGTPVSINKQVHKCDRIVLTGSVVLHYFGGFGGGRKSMVPGLASTETIAHNHAMNLASDSDILDPRVQIGTMQDNPVAEDMLEATQLSHVDFIINTVLNHENEILGIFVGALEEAHQAACTFAQDIFTAPIGEQADFVIAASPSTKNFVQTHKALFNAYRAMKSGGKIILLAPCPEGIGGEQFQQWLHLKDRASIIAALRKQSEINGQTALSTREKAPHMILVSEMNDHDVALLGATSAPTLQEAIQTVLKTLHQNGTEFPTYYLIPSAAYTVPKLSSQSE